MANRKKEVYKPKPMTEGKRNLIQGLLQEYDIQSADDIQEALKDLLSGTIQDMLETEMDNHLGYDRYERSGELNYRNGTKPKTVRSNMVNLRSMFLRIARVPLSLRCFQNARKTSLPSMTRSFRCMQKE